MSIKTLNPYLNFNGNAADALSLYEKALGAKVENLMRFSDLDFTDPVEMARKLEALSTGCEVKS